MEGKEAIEMKMNGGGFIVKKTAVKIFRAAKIMAVTIAAASICAAAFPAEAANVQPMVRVKDIATVEGVRSPVISAYSPR